MTKIDPKNARKIISKHSLADDMGPIIDLKKSHGSWLVDAKSGKEYLDLFSMFATMPIGYNHPYVLENADRLKDASINKPTNSDIYSVEMAEFMDTVAKIAQPDYLPHAFYISGGALAVENALKTAFDWKVRKNIKTGIGEVGSKIIHFKQAFHGRSGYTISLTDSHDKRKTKYFPKFPDWPRITNPKLTFPLSEENLKKVIELENKALAEIDEAVKKYSDDIAALIIEPIQGEGGDNHFRKEFFESLRKKADENDFLLIYDEVQTGVGLTGRMWAHEHFGDFARPDIMSFGKKTQVCGIFSSNKVDEVEDNVFSERSRLNSTFGGNLVDMVRFTLYLEVIEKEKILNKAKETGFYLLKRLEELQEENLISNARGRGLMCAFDAENSKKRDELRKLIQKEGALILGSGEKSIRFRPHLNISLEEVDIGIEIIRKAIKGL